MPDRDDESRVIGVANRQKIFGFSYRNQRMRRRALLASIGVLSAGCLESSPATESADDTATNEGYRLTSLTESTNVDRPSVAYILEPSAFDSGGTVGQEEQVVKDISEVADEAVRNAIETAIRAGEWRSDTLPGDLAEIVERVDFFTGVSEGDAHTHVGLTLYRFQPDQPPAVECSASIVDDSVSEGSPGAVAFELTNRGQTTQQVFSGTEPPFGVVSAESIETSDKFLLWRNYDEGCVRLHSGEICDVGTWTELQPSESVTRRYEVLPSDTSHHPEYTVPPGPGTYRITDSLRYAEEEGAPESKLSFEVQFTLEDLDLNR